LLLDLVLCALQEYRRSFHALVDRYGERDRYLIPCVPRLVCISMCRIVQLIRPGGIEPIKCHNVASLSSVHCSSSAAHQWTTSNKAVLTFACRPRKRDTQNNNHILARHYRARTRTIFRNMDVTCAVSVLCSHNISAHAHVASDVVWPPEPSLRRC